MRFLADESCDFAVVHALRRSGYDVSSVAESVRGADDSRVIELARSEQRVLLTEDKDFGQLVFAAARRTAGVILIRWPANARGNLAAAIVATVADMKDRLVGAFVVLEPGRLRVSR